MQLAAFYHCWAPGEWRYPLQEFLRALDESAYDGPLTLSVVGSLREVARVQHEVKREHDLIHAEEGFEQVTLEHILRYAQMHSGAVLYAHTKGAAAYKGHPDHPGNTSDPWRQIMTDLVVRDWQENLALLEDHDVVGWVWFDECVGWDPPGFAGNFWMACCKYLRKLPPPKHGDRGNAEVWLGSASPVVAEREHWNASIGPSVLQSHWKHLLQRWGVGV